MKLDSDTGNNVKSGAWGILAIFAPVIASMPEGHERTGLIVFFCLVMCAINWKTGGSGLNGEEARRIKEKVLNPTEEEIQQALREGRE